MIFLGDVIKYISCNLRFNELSLKNVFKHFLDKRLQYKRLKIQKNSRHEPCHATFLFGGDTMQSFCLVDLPCNVSVWWTCHAMFLFGGHVMQCFCLMDMTYNVSVLVDMPSNVSPREKITFEKCFYINILSSRIKN